MNVPEGLELRVDPPGATLRAEGWLVVCRGLPDLWDRQAVTDKLRNPWQPQKETVESKHEPGMYHEIFKFDKDGYQQGSQDYSEGVTGFWVDEDSVVIAVMGPIAGVRVMNEAAERLHEAHARRRESLEKIGVPTTVKGRKSFLMGKVGGSDMNNFAQVIKERKSVSDGSHPQLHTYKDWPDKYLAANRQVDSKNVESRRTRLWKFIARLLSLSEGDMLSASERERLEANWHEREKKRFADIHSQIEV